MPARIEKGPLAVELVEFSTPPASSTQRPYARLNYLFHAGDGTARVYVCDTRGKLWWIDTGSGGATLFLDLKKALGSAFPTPSAQMGLRSVAFHPDFARPGKPGYRTLYTVNTGTAASRAAGVPLFAMAPSTPVDHHNVITEWKVYFTLRTRVDPKSRREVLRIAQHRTDHSTDTILFNPTAKAGEPDYGKLYIGTGDGATRRNCPICTTTPRTRFGRWARSFGSIPCARATVVPMVYRRTIHSSASRVGWRRSGPSVFAIPRT